jgi:hypothetical protein
MSGKKEGILQVTEVEGEWPGGGPSVDILTPLVGLSIAGGAAVLAGGMTLYRGLLWIPRSLYRSVSKVAQRTVDREIQKIEQRITDALKMEKPTHIPSTHESSPSDRVLEGSALTPERAEIESMESLIALFTEEKDRRQEYEQKKGLRNDVSKEIEKEIQEYKRRKKEREEALKRREEELKKMKELETGEKKKELLKKIDRIYNIYNLLKEAYPDVVKNIKRELREIKLEKATINMLVKKYKLEKRLQSFQDPSVREGLLKLTSLRLKYEAIPFIQMLNPSQKDKFYEMLKTKRLKAEHGQLTEGDLRELYAILEEHQKMAEEMDRQNRFKWAKDRAIRALNNKGYNSIETESKGSYLEIVGTKKDGKKASISILRPDVEDESQPRLKIEIKEERYSDEEEWNAEGRELARELESLGIVLEFKEVMTHFKGKLLKSAAQVLKSELEAKVPDKTFEVRVEEDNYITINGMKLQWSVGTSTSELLSHYRQAISGETKIREREMIMERE